MSRCMRYSPLKITEFIVLIAANTLVFFIISFIKTKGYPSWYLRIEFIPAWAYKLSAFYNADLNPSKVPEACWGAFFSISDIIFSIYLACYSVLRLRANDNLPTSASDPQERKTALQLVLSAIQSSFGWLYKVTHQLFTGDNWSKLISSPIEFKARLTNFRYLSSVPPRSLAISA